MIKYDLDTILNENKELINLAKKYMSLVNDYEHDMGHVNDVVKILCELMDNLEFEFDPEVCIIAAYWHDVGRYYKDSGHEKISAEMLENKMINLGYNKQMIDKCIAAVKFHKWNMVPNTIEGKIIKDADKLAWLGRERWERCLLNNQSLESIIDLLPKLRNEILYFDYSRVLYDKLIVEIVGILYKIKNDN